MKSLTLHRNIWFRTLFLALAYTCVIALSRWLGFQLRFDFNIPPEHLKDHNNFFLLDVGLKLILLALFGQFSGVLGYFSIPDLLRMVYANTAASAILLALRLMNLAEYHVPRGVLLTDFLLSTVGLVGLRTGFRLFRERFLTHSGRAASFTKRVAIIGAGDVGASLAKELFTRRGLGLTPVAFFDDDKSKWKSSIHNVPVLGNPETLLNPKLNLQLDEAIIAMPSASAKRMGEIVKILHRTRLQFATVPSMDQLASGKVKVTQIRSVQIQDLLGRSPVHLEADHIRHILSDRIVMVTGSGGSIGSELCRQILTYNPSRLILVEHSEFLLFQIEQELHEAGYGATIQPVVADIGDTVRMRHVFETFEPDVIFHAAAHKHVPMMENQPAEAIKNNSVGTAKLSELALEYRVSRFILISTDKAINPTNVMGATKRLAELHLQSLHREAANRGLETKFMAVRFGNVLGSSGSVIPTFNKQIAAGGPVKVTHPDVTRYFMTIPEAVGLVLQSASQGSGGEIFVLDMGKPVKIADLAKQLIELSGLRPGDDIEIEYTGLRPGEKLFEELSHQGENITPTSHPKIMRFVTEPPTYATVKAMYAEITEQMHDLEPNQLKQRLKKAIPEYRPYLT